MKLKVFLLFFLLQGICHAQQLIKAEQYPFLFAERIGPQLPGYIAYDNAATVSPAPVNETDGAPVLKPYENTFRHTAFFCKMEENTAKRFGISIQVRTANYDAYMRDASPYSR